MNKDTLIDTLIDYLNHNKDICISKEPKLVILDAHKLVEQTSSHGAYLLFKIRTQDIVYNPHRFSEQQIKELSLLVPDYSLVPAVPKGDLMFWTGFEML